MLRIPHEEEIEQIGKELFSTRDKSKQAKSIFKEFFTPSDICDFYES